MKVASVIDDENVIKKILKHLDLWQVKPRPPPKATGPTKIAGHSIDYSTSQLPGSDPPACFIELHSYDSQRQRSEFGCWHLKQDGNAGR